MNRRSSSGLELSMALAAAISKEVLPTAWGIVGACKVLVIVVVS
jgi:hypothetical protein